MWGGKWGGTIFSSRLNWAAGAENSHGMAIHVRETFPISLSGGQGPGAFVLHIVQLQVGTFFRGDLKQVHIIDKWKLIRWQNANVDISTPGMCPCPILSSLWGQQLITFEATPKLVSHLCCLLFPFDGQQFKATPCLVSHLPFAPLLLSPPWCNSPPCQSFGLPPSSTGLATLRGDA